MIGGGGGVRNEMLRIHICNTSTANAADSGMFPVSVSRLQRFEEESESGKSKMECTASMSHERVPQTVRALVLFCKRDTRGRNGEIGQRCNRAYLQRECRAEITAPQTSVFMSDVSNAVSRRVAILW